MLKFFIWVYFAITLKRKCHHFDEIFITGCTESCQNDNFRCSQWWRFHQNDDIFVSLWYTNFIRVPVSHGSNKMSFMFVYFDGNVHVVRYICLTERIIPAICLPYTTYPPTTTENITTNHIWYFKTHYVEGNISIWIHMSSRLACPFSECYFSTANDIWIRL